MSRRNECWREKLATNRRIPATFHPRGSYRFMSCFGNKGITNSITTAPRIQIQIARKSLVGGYHEVVS